MVGLNGLKGETKNEFSLPTNGGPKFAQKIS